MVRTDSVSRTVAVFIISHKNNLFSEIILKNGLSRWLLKWGGKIFSGNTLTKHHFCRNKWRDNISRCFVEFHKNKLFPETCKKLACFMGSIYEGICADFMKLKKSWETPLLLPILNAYHMRGISGPKIFLQNTLTKPRFSRDKWRGIVPLNAAWQVHNHSSVTFFPTRAGRPCAMTILCERQPRASTAR